MKTPLQIKILNAVIRIWPYIWFAILMFWLVIIMPTLTLMFHFICWLIDSTNEGIQVDHGANYNILTGEIDPHKRADGHYLNDSLTDRDPRH